MSKELEALEEIKKEHYVDGRLPLIDKIRFDIIETALKDYIPFDEGLKIGELIIVRIDEEIAKQRKLKALEIIKEKNVNIWVLKNSKTLKTYIEGCYTHEQITQDEFDLLKEVVL